MHYYHLNKFVQISHEMGKNERIKRFIQLKSLIIQYNAYFCE